MKSVDPKKLRARMIKLFREKLKYFENWEWENMSGESIQERNTKWEGWLEGLCNAKIITLEGQRKLWMEKDKIVSKILEEHF